MEISDVCSRSEFLNGTLGSFIGVDNLPSFVSKAILSFDFMHIALRVPSNPRVPALR
jgi:hypothetical protein